MTDIVERLRTACSSAGDYTETTYNKLLLREAANVIERLEIEIEGLRRLCRQQQTKLAEYENVPVRIRHIQKKMHPDE